MLSFLASKPGTPVPEAEIQARYNHLRWHALFGIFIGYVAYYILRNNFLLSSPELISDFGFTKKDIGFISGTMLIVYGISKGVMSALADKSNPKHFMIFGVLMSAIVNLLMGFSASFWIFLFLCILNGIFQGMGAGPAYVVLASWFPRKSRGVTTAIFNISHNVGGGLVAPIAGASIAWLGQEHWQAAHFIVPMAIATFIALLFYIFGTGRTYNEGLPPTSKILGTEKEELVVTKDENINLTTWQILRDYILKDINVWFVSFIDVFTYMIRFGVLTWLPLYLLETKGFSKGEMSAAFAIFEWAAIPSTLLAGWLTDTYFKGRRMPLAIITLVGVGLAMFAYWGGQDLLTVTIGAGIIGCLIYVPMFLSSLQTIELVPSFAAGSATGLRGLLSYILGSFSGTALFGILAERFGWDAGFYLLLFAVCACIFCCYMTHLGVMRLEKRKSAAAK
ncbi:MFS transporter [Gallibacterium anatis]|uniref:sn-glycerol-3-phosphate transporter n=2 Tax=Gallibacterium anatis TaxID=750 RepID=F4H9Y7_GALAU|nr:MFS transporter [Gallibacterium anatis]AEC17295.1 sn-glycerol-3-phosphate transporter [Gallibacterium anatis UMN179]KGQ45895.1 phosphoglycerate transporter [Gallibacterium anatis]KGQ60601.1 phosphoglycerate transporter [Gallibacterium anatis 7990]MDK9430180.1 MFS transporter [Gallibacterium anatis]WIM79386.1 MFS transporter [Gallibacterium anatis]